MITPDRTQAMFMPCRRSETEGRAACTSTSYEPRDDRAKGIAAELRAARIVPVPIAETFFQRRSGIAEPRRARCPPLLLADGAAILDQIGKLRAAGCTQPDRGHARLSQRTCAARDARSRGRRRHRDPAQGRRTALARLNSITRRAHGHAARKRQVGAITAYFDGRDPESQVSGFSFRGANMRSSSSSR